MASNPIESSTSTFLGMGLKVGDRMQLDPPAKITGGARVVRLVGYTEDRSLLVSMPDEKNWSGSLIEGDTVLIRTFSGRKAFSFNTRVLRRAVSPYEYLHLEFPSAVSSRRIRRAERVRTDIAVQLKGADARAVRVTNLSATGAELRGSAAAGEVGESLSFTLPLKLHFVDIEVQCEGTVRNAHSLPDGGVACGVEFAELDNQSWIMLRSYVYQHLLDSPSGRV